MALIPVLRATALSFALVLAGASLSAASAQKASQAVDELDPEISIAELAVETARWVIASGDNHGLPFAVIDKKTAQILVFGADGKARGVAPTLIGSAEGDDSAPGIADRELKDIPMKDRTTPAGRFLAAYGRAAGDQRVLWVDYDTAISIHPLPERETREQRTKRLTSADPDDNRITHGCINVSPEFYSTVVQPLFAEGGVFYVLPDKRSLPDAFPTFTRRMASPSEGNVAVNSFMGG
jgi:hypothetical protein